MKAKIVVLISALAVIVVVIGGYLLISGDDHQHDTAQADIYTCPMHPSVQSDRPGACPVCGMALVRKSDAGAPNIDSELLGALSLSPTQRVVANITTTPVVRGTYTREITAIGLVTSAEPLNATVAARFRGRIEKLHANVTGERVARGNPLFELYSPDLISAQREFQLSAERRSTPASLIDTGEMQDALYHAARERLLVHFGLTEDQVLRLEQTGEVRNTVQFHAPISGTVMEKGVVEGDYVDEGMTLYRLADLSRVWIILDVYEKDLSSVRKGQTILVNTEAYPGKELSGTVTFIDPVVDPSTRTVRVRTEFDNRNGLLKPNMYVTARVSTTVGPVLLVPSRAVMSTGTRNVVWVEVGENAFEPRSVGLGGRNSETVEVITGLREGDLVAATGGFLIDSESALQFPSAQDPHAGHGDHTDDGADPEAVRGNDISIRVKGGYTPRVLHIRKGEPTKLRFLREESARCTEEVVLREFGLRAFLPEGEEVVLEITPDKTGEFVFSCGMNMIHGKLIVTGDEGDGHD